MRKAWLVVLITAIVLVCLTGSVFAWHFPINGRPEMYSPGETRGYFIWQDHEGMHLRVTTKGQEHRFSGIIRTDGQFFAIDGKRLEWNDRMRVDHERNTIHFSFAAAGGIDGIDFKVHGGHHLRFELHMDGHNVRPQEIYVGAEGWQPRRSNFTLYR